MADIFISYKREDQEEHGRVRPIAEALSAEGYDVFYDVQVPPGSSWESVLQSKINAARAVIVLWSQASVDSDWVKEEAEMAKNAGKLIPVFLDPVQPPFGFARIEGANLSDWNGDLDNIEWKNLVAAIKTRIGAGEGVTQPGVTRVAYQPTKTVTVEKRAPRSGGGGGIMKAVLAVIGLAILAGVGVVAYNSVQQSRIAQDRADDIAVDEAMTRGIDERAWNTAKAADTIDAYRRYLAERPTGAYRSEAISRIEELEAASATVEPPEPAVPTPADLAIRGVQLGATRVTQGGTVRVSTELINLGGTDAPGSSAGGYMVDYVLSRDASAPVRFATYSDTWSEDALLRGGRASNTSAVLANRGTQSWTETVTVPEGWPAGRFNLCAVVDPGGKVVESSVANNVTCTPLEVEAAASTSSGVSYRPNGVYIEVTRIWPSGDTISLTNQDFAVSFTYSVPANRRMDVLVQPRYSGTGTCHWSAVSQPGVLAGNGNFTVRFRFSGNDCRNKTLTAVNFRVAPESDSTDWDSADHAVRYGMH